MHRVIVFPRSSTTVTLPPEEARHLVKVLRLPEGSLFEGLAETGQVLLCRLAREHGEWIGEVVREIAENRESPFRIHLAPALIKPERFEWLLQKGVELGVISFQPLLTRYSQSTHHGGYTPRRLDRWRRIVREAVKQSGRALIPRVEEPLELTRLGERFDPAGFVCLDEAGDRSLQELGSSLEGCSECVLLVGPEGGWDEAERDWLSGRGVPRFGLGPRILRSETAAVAAVTLVQFLLGDLGTPGARSGQS
ncbi:MAG: 16S rRNA (uracil(1498)-N(3))-methyltransferase [Acidobacteriota bacterium]